MDTRLAVTLSQDQVAAASVIHDSHMLSWAGTDRALALLRKAVPGFSAEAVLVKAAAVDRLYYTRHYRLGDAVERIISAMTDPPDDPIAIVEGIAELSIQGKTRWYWSFASKFCHWFIDPQNLPIYDSWAIRSIGHHFGRLRWAASAYRTFAEYVYDLRELSDVSCRLRELDRYLWLSGMYRAWRENPDVAISGEVRELFDSNSPQVQQELVRLTGTDAVQVQA